MRRRAAAACAAGAAALALAAAPGASAATEIGSSCSAQGGTQNYTLLQLSTAPGNPPLSVPATGVITQWKVNIGVPVPSYGQRLKVFRPTGNTNEFTAVAQSDVGSAVTGQNVFPTRIPVQAGDRIGASAQGPTQAIFYCATKDPADKLGLFAGDVPVGSTQTFGENEEVKLALAAIVEPDADNDGFGDETQDKCPQSAAVQVECPVVVLDSFALAKKSSIVVLVNTDESAPVTVSGSVKLPKGAKKASASAKAKLKKVTHNVPAGKLVRFTLKFPGDLKSALRSLPHGKSLTVKLQATATNVAGQVSKDKAKVKLR